MAQQSHDCASIGQVLDTDRLSADSEHIHLGLPAQNVLSQAQSAGLASSASPSARFMACSPSEVIGAIKRKIPYLMNGFSPCDEQRMTLVVEILRQSPLTACGATCIQASTRYQ